MLQQEIDSRLCYNLKLPEIGVCPHGFRQRLLYISLCFYTYIHSRINTRAYTRIVYVWV